VEAKNLILADIVPHDVQHRLCASHMREIVFQAGDAAGHLRNHLLGRDGWRNQQRHVKQGLRQLEDLQKNHGPWHPENVTQLENLIASQSARIHCGEAYSESRCKTLFIAAYARLLGWTTVELEAAQASGAWALAGRCCALVEAATGKRPKKETYHDCIVDDAALLDLADRLLLSLEERARGGLLQITMT
jgi:hypothetical protein